jgi:cytolysin-activating lysine-acyltransferase
MQYGNLIITAPVLDAPGHSEAEIFGSIVWLAMQANNKNRLPLQDLSQWLLPALRTQQFILASESIDGKTRPVAYMSWANLTAEVESRYVDNPDEGLSPQEWTGGDRMWVIDWMTPFGHSKVFRRAVGAALTGCCFKSLYHRGGDRGLRVMLFRGDHVSLEQAKQWWKDRPILARRATQLEDEVNQTSS